MTMRHLAGGFYLHACACTFLVACQAVNVPIAPSPAPVPGEMIVRFAAPVAEIDRSRLRESLGAARLAPISALAEVWRVPVGHERATCGALSTNSAVRFTQLNMRRHWMAPLQGEPEPPVSLEPLRGLTQMGMGLPWQLAQTGFGRAWEMTTGQDVTVAVVDSGVDPEHPALKGHLLPLIDEVAAMGRQDTFDGDDYAGRDGHGHGTHVTGLVVASRLDARAAGGAPGARVLPVKVTPANGETDDATIAKGIVEAAERGAQVINLSIGGPEPSPILLDALNEAFARGAAVVIASGNDGGGVNFPAAYGGVVSVGALTRDGRVASYSSRGAALVLVAPGGGAPGRDEGPGLTSTLPTYPTYLSRTEGKPTGYGTLSGTSMAAPLVTSAIALLLSLEPGLSPAQVRTRLAATTDDIGSAGFDEASGYGRLNALQMLHKATDDGSPAPHSAP